MRCLCTIAVLFQPTFSFTQTWVARYDGPVGSNDEAYSLVVDGVGNVYVTGQSWGDGTWYDYATVKYDSLGVEQWVARYNGPNNGDDYASSIALDNAGNVYVTGKSSGMGTGFDYATVKYDPLGVEQWVVRYNGPANDWDAARAIVLDDAGNIYVTGTSVAGSSNNDYATVKYNSLGIEQWVMRYNGPGNWTDRAFSLAVDNAGNIYVTGESTGPGMDFDYATVNYNSLGIEQWVARYDGPGSVLSHDDNASSLVVDNMGYVYVTGQSAGDGTWYDYATVKYDPLGVEQWVARYDGPANYVDSALSIAIDNTGNVYVTGMSWGQGTSFDYATVKYDSLGVEQWAARYNGSPGDGADWAKSVTVDTACNVHVTGQSMSEYNFYDYATLKYDSFGVEQYIVRYDGPGHADDKAFRIVVDDALNTYVTGGSTGAGPGKDYATIKYSPTGIEENKLTVKKGNKITTTIFHGPLQLLEGKKCEVYDITGRVMEPSKIQPGIYFIEVDGVVTQKVVKVR